jgi:hypothetical protein
MPEYTCTIGRTGRADKLENNSFIVPREEEAKVN